MRDCRVFRDFTWSDDGGLDDFGRFNLIYGWNGSGKSTLSYVLRSLERREQPEAGTVSLELDGRDRAVMGNEFSELLPDEISIRVFNQDFVNATVFPVNGDDVDIDPIFVLGENSADVQRRLDALMVERTAATSLRNDARNRADDTKARLERHASSAAKIVKETLGGRGDPTYRNYFRPQFEQRAKVMIENGGATSHVLPEAERQRLDDVQRARLRDRIEAPPEISVDVRTVALRTSVLLQRSALSASAIQSLLGDAELTTWVRDGLALHADRDSENCLYCEQALPAERTARLMAHFDDAYQRLSDEVDTAIEDYRTIDAQVSKASSGIPPRDGLYEDLVTAYDAAQSDLRRRLSELQRFIAAQSDSLEAKKARLHEPMPFADVELPAGDDLTNHVADIVRQHNERCDEFDDRVADARKALESHIVAGQLPAYEELSAALAHAEEQADQAAQDFARLTREIDALERQVRDDRIPADRLNDDLRAYLGHDQLQLEVREHGYAVVRDGEPARHPSDGERAAIALLYFLRSLDDHRFDLKTGVVVLDDPVSSLDENALHLAAGLIRARTKNAMQLFVLTHNFNFFRQVRDWFESANRNADGKTAEPPGHFYMLRPTLKHDHRTSALAPLDPLLQQYQSDYHFLFSRIYAAANPPNGTLEDVYPLPNLTRRFLEAFLAFKLPGPQTLRDKLNDVDFDDARKARIVSFVHTYSHDDVIDAPQHDLSVLSEAPAVAQHVLDLVKQMDSTHYRRLERITGRALANARQ